MKQSDRGIAVTESCIQSSIKCQATSVVLADLRGVVKQYHSSLISSSSRCNSEPRNRSGLSYQKDRNTYLASKWYGAMRVNNAPRHLVPHQMNVRLRRYPESAYFRALGVIGNTTRFALSTLSNLRSNRRGSTNWRSSKRSSPARGTIEKARRSDDRWYLHRERVKETTRRLAHFTQ